MLESYFLKVAELHCGCFTEQQQTATWELKKEGGNIDHQLFCLSQELQKVSEKAKFRFFDFY